MKYIYIYITCQNEGGRKNQTLFPVIKFFCILKIWNNNLSKYVLYFKDSSWLTSLKNPFLFYLCSCLLPKIKTIRSEKNFFSSLFSHLPRSPLLMSNSIGNFTGYITIDGTIKYKKKTIQKLVSYFHRPCRISLFWYLTYYFYVYKWHICIFLEESAVYSYLLPNNNDTDVDLKPGLKWKKKWKK